MSATTRVLANERAEAARAFLAHNTLPDWLIHAVAPDNVLEGLRQHVTEFAVGALKASSCKVKQVRLQEADGCWTAMYSISYQQTHTGEKLKAALLGTIYPPSYAMPAFDSQITVLAFASDGWECILPEVRLHLQLPPPDQELNVLPQLVDSEHSRTLLETSMRASNPSYRDIRIAKSTPQLMRSHAGLRHTLRYTLEYDDVLASQNWPRLVVGKTYDDATGEQTYRSMRALWDSSLAAQRVVTIAEPLAYAPELNLLVQGPIYEEQTLEEMIENAVELDTVQAYDEVRSFMQKTARGLAALHATGVREGQHHAWSDELDESRAKLVALRKAVPELAAAAAPLIDWLVEYDAAHPPDADVPTHGTFRPAQVLIHEGSVGFIDFDDFCQAEPAMDLARFTAAVRDSAQSALSDKADKRGEAVDQATRERCIAEIDAICDAFLGEYRAQRSFSNERLLLWETSEHLKIVLACWLKGRTVRLTHAITLLEGRLRALALSV